MSNHSPSRRCPSLQTLSAFAAGRTIGDEAEQLIDHVDTCPSCQSKFAELEESNEPVDDVVDRIRRIEPDRNTTAPSFVQNLLQRGVTRSRTFPSNNSNGDSANGDSANDNSANDNSGRVPDLIDNYSLVREIARGGMGTVYEVRHIHLGRTMALKLIGQGALSSREQAGQVLREWRAHGRLKHPAIVSATDAGMVDGRPYLVTELVEGAALDQIVKVIGPLNVADACQIIAAVIDALAYAHGKDIAHLDIKPSNIMLTNDGDVRLLDWGTAAVFEAAVFEAAVFEAAAFEAGGDAHGAEWTEYGTAGFIAPERIADAQGSKTKHPEGHRNRLNPRSKPSDKPSDTAAGFAADVYSLGCTLRYLINGQIGESVEFAVNDPATQQSRDRLVQRIEEMLDPDPNRRTNDVRKFADDLNEFAKGADLASIAKSAVTTDPTVQLGPSGQTLQVSQLLESTATAKQKRRRRSLAAVTLIGIPLLIALCLWLVPSNTSLPVSGSPMITAASRVMDMWRYVPKTDVGFCFRSQELLERAVAVDPTVQHVTMITTAPRHVATSLAISPDGNRIAVETRGHETRIYRFDGEEIHLETMIAAANPRDRTTAVVWHPLDGSLIGLSSRFMAVVQISADGDYQIEVQDFAIEKPEAIHVVVDGQNVLAIVVAEGRAVGWDLVKKELIDPITPQDMSHFTATDRDDSFAFAIDGQAEIWQAVAEPTIDGSDYEWKFQRSLSLNHSEASEIFGIELDRDGARVAVRTADAVEIFDASTGEMLGTIPTDADWDDSEPFVFIQSDPVSIGFRTDSELHCRSLDENQWATEYQGQRLMSAMMKPHPVDESFFIALPGGLEIWDVAGATIDRVPGVEPIVRSMPLANIQSGAASLLIRTDGGGLVLNDDGQVLGSMLSPVDPNKLGCRWVNHHAISDDPFRITQANYPDDPNAVTRSLTPLGLSMRPISDAARKPVPPSLLRKKLHAHRRVVIDQPTGKAIVLEEESFTVHDLRDSTSKTSDLQVPGDSPCIATDRSMKTMYAIGNDQRNTRLVAVDLDSGTLQWEAAIDSPASVSSVAVLSDGQLLVNNWFGAWMINAEAGSRSSDLFPIERHGFHQASSAKHPIGGTIHTWHVSQDPEPLACWTPKMQLRWLAIATCSDQWIVLDPSGNILAEIQSKVVAKKRFIGKTKETYRQASWHPSASSSRKHPPPRASMSLLRFHKDGRITAVEIE